MSLLLQKGVEKVLNNRITSLNSEDIIIIKKSTEQIEQNFKSISHNRITEENKDLNICKCKASIEFNNGYNYDFAYSVQETETHYYTELINMFEFNFIEILKNLDFTYKPKIKEFNKTNQSKIKSNIKSDSYYKNQIRSLLKTEDTRNFDEVIKYYNLKNLKRYWNISNPSYTELSEAYKKSWNTTVNSSNSINRIEKKYERVYDTNLDFTFSDDTININPCELIINRTWTATDNCSNATQVTQIITVQDIENPVLAGLPIEI